MQNVIRIEYKHGIPANHEMMCAYFGAIENGHRVIPFLQEDLENFPTSLFLSTTWIGTMPSMNHIFGRLGIPVNTFKPTGREDMTETTWGDKKAEFLKDNVPFFIKPLQTKLFDGTTISNEPEMNFLWNISESEKVWTAPILDIVSEYRCYIGMGKIKYASHYLGDFRITPDWSIYDKMVKDNFTSATFPNYYSMDVFCLADGSSIVGEFNDLFSLGCYGIPNDNYCSLLIQRYAEIIAKKYTFIKP